MSYIKIPDEYNFNTKFDTYILAFCPDSDSWFATNMRFFYYEYEMDFPDEATAIEYFKQHPDIFFQLEKRMEVQRPRFYDGGVYLANTNELVMLS